MVTDLLDVLDARARYAVEQRFGLHDGRKRSYREVGEELGVTAEAARRLVKRAVNAVRDQAAGHASTPPDHRRIVPPFPTLRSASGAAPPARGIGWRRRFLSAATATSSRGRPGPRRPGGTARAAQQPDWPDAAALEARPQDARRACPRWCSPARPAT